PYHCENCCLSRKKRCFPPLFCFINLVRMANTINSPRTHLIMGLCLPLAVLLGYFLAQPLESASIAVVVMVLSLLCVPLFMKWHHPLLVLSWNAAANPLFLP